MQQIVAPTPWDDSGILRTANGQAFEDLPPSLVSMLRSTVDRVPDREALVELGGDRLTYEQVWDRSARVAGGLRELGVSSGDRVAIRLPNGIDWCLAFFGSLLAGGVPVPVNTRFRTHEVEHVLTDSGSSYVVEPGIALPQGDPYVIDGLGPDDLAALFYTSGTTGFPKGAALSHRNVLSALEAAQRAMLLPDTGVRTLVPVPLFHVMGALNQLLPTVRVGGTTVIMAAFEVDRWVEAMAVERIDVVSAVPAIYWQALQLPAFSKTDTSGVGWAVYGGAATPPAQVLRLREAFPRARLFSGYGMTETSGGITGVPHEHAVERSDGVGLALPTVELALDGPELLVRAPQVMTGYWNNPSATEEVLVDGWLRTGDAAVASADGFVRIVDRIKDTVIRGGENVYCIEVENVLLAHPSVLEVAVLAVPDEALGERVGAVVVGEVDPLELVRWAAPQLAGFKVPEHVVLRTGPLPRNAAGKVEKAVLRGEVTWGPLLQR
ncbi:MAG: putative fatty-acid--CoA ligase [Frankiales bacterium]|nr:putative fatty-acid--CoA ligase [Frankiales bacterium]